MQTLFEYHMQDIYKPHIYATYMQTTYANYVRCNTDINVIKSHFTLTQSETDT